MAKLVKKVAEVSKAFGEDLDTPIRFSYEYEELQSGDEIPAKEALDADDMRKFVNARRNASARSKAQNEALSEAGIKAPELKDNVDLQIKTIVKALVAAGNTPDVAEQMARQLLNK